MNVTCGEIRIIYSLNYKIEVVSDQMYFCNTKTPSVIPVRKGDEIMERLNNIPAEIRWDIATRCADAIPFAYDKAIRQIAADKPEEIEQAERKIWKNIGRTQGKVARDLGYPLNNALDVAQAVNELSIIMFGPDFKSEVKQDTADSATAVIKKCPLVNNTKRFNKDPKESCTLCNAFFISAADSLNSDYKVNFDKHICMGDSCCQMRISKK